MSDTEIVIGKGVPVRRGVYYFDVALAEWEENDVADTMILFLEDGEWNFWQIDKRIIDFEVHESEGVRYFRGISEDGFASVDADGQLWRHIDKSHGGPNRLKHLTAMCRVGDSYFAVGMSRMVYKSQVDSESWSRFDKGIARKHKDEDVAGFRAIDGFDADELYAVGYDGDLWVCRSGVWQDVPVATNVVLNAVKAASDGVVYVCGNEGVLLSGRLDEWTLVENDVCDADLWDVEEFAGTLYFCSDSFPLYCLEDGRLEPVESGVDDASAGSLHSAEGILLSVGEDEIFTFDGDSWEQVVIPPYG